MSDPPISPVPPSPRTSTGARMVTATQQNWPAVATTAILSATILALVLTGHANMVTVTVVLLGGGSQALTHALARRNGK